MGDLLSYVRRKEEAITMSGTVLRYLRDAKFGSEMKRDAFYMRRVIGVIFPNYGLNFVGEKSSGIYISLPCEGRYESYISPRVKR